MYQFTSNDLVDNFELESNFVNSEVKELNIFEWTTVSPDEEGGIDLYLQSVSEADQYGWRIEWRIAEHDDDESL